jgi:FixJ family two-component response regulator
VTTRPATVFVVDDDASVRRSLVRLLTQAGYRSEAFASAPAFLERRHREGPCCLVLDVRLPGLTGLDLQEALAGAGERMAIVFITAHGDVPMTARAMKAGAVDFLVKPYSREDLLAAVEQAVTRDAREREARAQVAEVEARLRTLTAREADVLALVVRGLLNKQIAGELGITEGTVKIHRARVMEKMRAPSVAELVRLTERIAPAADTRPERPGGRRHQPPLPTAGTADAPRARGPGRDDGKTRMVDADGPASMTPDQSDIYTRAQKR